MKVAMDMMPRKMPGGEYSHTASWAFLRANQLKHVGVDVKLLHDVSGRAESDWSEYDVVYLYHTMDFLPEHEYLLNVFDGPQEHVAKFFERLIWEKHKHIKFISLDYPMPNYGYRCKRKRDRADITTKMSDYWKNCNWDEVQDKCDAIQEWVLDPGVKLILPFEGRVKDDWIKQCSNVEHIHRNITMGDSHTQSVYTPGNIVLRHDGRTLAGIIKKGIKKEIADHGYDFDQLDKITGYWGNIDIRHHLCREANPTLATKELVANYVKELLTLDRKIEVVTPVPIEFEERKLPSTGLYQGTPFFGSRAERQELVNVFKGELLEAAAKHGFDVWAWPEDWYKMDGQEYSETIMERPRSIHLARRFYRWDLENDVLNSRLDKVSAKSNLLEF